MAAISSTRPLPLPNPKSPMEFSPSLFSLTNNDRANSVTMATLNYKITTPLDMLLSNPIRFVKATATTKSAECQPAGKRSFSSLGYFEEEEGRKRKRALVTEEPRAECPKKLVGSEAARAPTHRPTKGIPIPLTKRKATRDISPLPKRQRIGLRVKGLPNEGQFCYRNSVLQFLAASPELLESISHHGGQKKCKVGAGCVSCALARLFEDHFRPSGKKHALNSSIAPVKRLARVLPSPFGVGDRQQEDASEYMLAVLNKGIEQLAEGENHFNNVFGGKYVSVLTCPKCKNRSVTPENHITLQLHPSARSNEPICLRKCLASNFSAEEVEASCGKCKYKTGSSRTSQRFCKKVEINRLPNFLIINISRHMNVRVDAYGRFHPQKLMNPVALNERMVLKEEGDKEVVYKLKAMIAHSGRRMGSGHYIAFTKQPDRAWVICDDTRATETSFERLRRQTNVQVSVLGYERIN